MHAFEKKIACLRKDAISNSTMDTEAKFHGTHGRKKSPWLGLSRPHNGPPLPRSGYWPTTRQQVADKISFFIFSEQKYF
jgi:hypothetical protein